MKSLLFLFAVLFAASACNSPNFAPAPDKLPEGNQQEDYQQGIPSAVKAEMKPPKVGGKDRKTINISETVNEKKLKGKKSIVTNINVTNVIVDKYKKPGGKRAKRTKKTVIERIMEKVVVRKTASSEKKLDILFYMHDRDTNCIRNVIAHSEKKGFLKHLNHLDWQVSFSYYSQVRTCSEESPCKTGFLAPHFANDELAMLPLEWNNGEAHDADKDFWKFKEEYVLSKGEYTQKQADRLFNTTLTAFHPEADGVDEVPPSHIGLNTNPTLYWAVLNPLSGLDAILSKKHKGSVRLDSHVIVLLFGYNFPYYFPTEWKSFFNKHKNVSIIAVSYRSANVSNFEHLLEKDDYNFDFLPACDDDSSPAQIIQAIKNKVR